MLNNPGWKDVSHSKPCKLVNSVNSNSSEGERPEYVLPTVQDYIRSAYELQLHELKHTIAVLEHTLAIATAQQVVSRFITEMKTELEINKLVLTQRIGNVEESKNARFALIELRKENDV